MNHVRMRPPRKEKKETKIIPVFGINTDNVTGYDPLGLTLVTSDQAQQGELSTIKPKFQIKTVFSRNAKCQKFLTALEVNSLWALSLWNNEESYFKEMINFCSTFTGRACFFFIQRIDGIKKIPTVDVNNTYNIEQIDYGCQFIIASSGLKNPNETKNETKNKTKNEIKNKTKNEIKKVWSRFF